MKNYTLTNLLLLASITLFTACSTETPKVPKKSQSAQSIMGIEGARTVAVSSVYNNTSHYAMAKTYPISPMVESKVSYNDIPLVESSRIEPVVTEEYNNYVPESRIEIVSTPTQQHYYDDPSSTTTNSIEVVSYASQQPVIDRIYQKNTNIIAKEVESKAKRLLGIKYVWGATGPNKYDCSGFTQKIFRDAGIKIPRVSRDQAKVGKYIRYSSLRKGDMVFFDTQKRRTGKVTHVGIYLGSGNFIHASSGAKKIVIYNFNQKKFYKNRFLWGRRVIKNDAHLAAL